MSINLCVTLVNLFETYELETVSEIFNGFYMILVLAGAVFLIKMLITERFPYATPEQSERGFRLSLTSPLLMGVLLCHIGSMIYYIVQENA
jgi:hypothetical protein